MNERIGNEQHLVEALRSLPREISPDKELWPGIEGRLGTRETRARASARSGWPLQALAASVAIAFVAGLMFGRFEPQ
ncbi:MAG: hypothetical protein R3348_09270, partial [Xanthomonadales bacterium]|nr:hypothetical protein [Xanthomonadales bacterium]